MNPALAGKRVLITRSDAFMGPVLCDVLAQHGASINANCSDLLDPRAAADLVATAGNVDVLVVNLAIAAPTADAVESTEEEWKTVFATNVDPLPRLIRAVLPQMSSRIAGVILVMGRESALRGMRRSSTYRAARGAQLAYVQSVGVGVARHHVRVNAIAQNFVDNPTYFPPEVQADARFQERMLRWAGISGVRRVGCALTRLLVRRDGVGRRHKIPGLPVLFTNTAVQVHDRPAALATRNGKDPVRKLLLVPIRLGSPTACATGDQLQPSVQSTVTLPLQEAWYQGTKVYYISTDMSDPGMSQMMGVTTAFRLREAVPPHPKPPQLRTVLERIYKFPQNDRNAVLRPHQRPSGPPTKKHSTALFGRFTGSVGIPMQPKSQ